MRLLDHLSSHDTHHCHRIVDECRELGADTDGWRVRLIESLRTLVGARVIIMAELVNLGPAADGPMRSLATHRIGWADPQSEARWREYSQSVPVEHTPEYPYINRFTGQGLTLSRDEIWGRTSWYRSRTFNEVHRACGIDDYVMSVRATDIPGRSVSIWIHREVGDVGFTPRDRAIIGLVHDEVGRAFGSFLARADEPRLATLTQRQRQVLSRLLRGDAEKQIAYELDLSRATVHDHVLALHRHFGVSSRGELLSRFIGRARPALNTEHP